MNNVAVYCNAADFVGNDVHVFSKNTTTIDMFGSVKYRIYEYGGDDHVAVAHGGIADESSHICYDGNS